MAWASGGTWACAGKQAPQLEEYLRVPSAGRTHLSTQGAPPRLSQTRAAADLWL